MSLFLAIFTTGGGVRGTNRVVMILDSSRFISIHHSSRFSILYPRFSILDSWFSILHFLTVTFVKPTL